MGIEVNFESGKIVSLKGEKRSCELEYQPHKSFIGVSLMHLVTGEETNHQMSCHLVRVEPNCNLDTHIHGENLELHEVIAGTGICYLENNKYEYAQGTITIIPAGSSHKVVAGEDGLYILAKFTPALL